MHTCTYMYTYMYCAITCMCTCTCVCEASCVQLGSVQRYLNPKIKCSEKYLLSNDTSYLLEFPH